MIYFDNSASSPLSEGVLALMREELGHFANPSSLHRLGFEAEQRLKKAREQVAKSIGALPEEIFFTSGGTEADNLAIFGAVQKLHRRGNRIITTDSEHPAVAKCIDSLERDGFEVIRLSTRGGALDPVEIAKAANEKTILVAAMHTNNETGAIYDIPTLARLVKAKSPFALIFSDAVQGYLKSPITPTALGVDLLSLSAHKICGPKGVGALYVKKGTNLPARMLGGGQEKSLRSGTENLPGIIAFGKAAEEGKAEFEAGCKRMGAIRDRIKREFAGSEKISFNEAKRPSCHILSMTVRGLRSEILLHMLSEQEVFVSSGSACSSHSGKSPVLQNFGLSQKDADSTIRLSFSRLNTEDEAVEFCRILREIIR